MAEPVPAASAAPPGARASRRPRSPWRTALRILVLTLVLGEVAARVLTGTAKNGMPRIGRVPLLPYRPSEEILAADAKRRDAGSEASYVVPHPALGWTVAPSAIGREEGRVLYRSNSQGARTDPARVFAEEVPAGVVRIVTVGDSYCHGDEVTNEETWQAYLEEGRSDLEVVNLGVPGAGTDQAYLRWRADGRAFRPQIAILAIWPENMCRNLNVIRYYLTPAGSYVSKPRLLFEGGVAKTINSPILERDALHRALADPLANPYREQDHWCRERETRDHWAYASRGVRALASYWNAHVRREERQRMYDGRDTRGIEVTVAIAELFVRDAREAGALPLVLLIPMRDLLDLHAAEEPFPLVAALRRAGIEVVDLGPTFGAEMLAGGVERYYRGQGHHNAAGNRLLAEHLGRALAPSIASARE